MIFRDACEISQRRMCGSLAPCGEDQDRNVRCVSDGAANFPSLYVGKRQIEHNEDGVIAPRQLQRLMAIVCGNGLACNVTITSWVQGTGLFVESGCRANRLKASTFVISLAAINSWSPPSSRVEPRGSWTP